MRVPSNLSLECSNDFPSHSSRVIVVSSSIDNLWPSAITFVIRAASSHHIIASHGIQTSKRLHELVWSASLAKLYSSSII